MRLCVSDSIFQEEIVIVIILAMNTRDISRTVTENVNLTWKSHNTYFSIWVLLFHLFNLIIDWVLDRTNSWPWHTSWDIDAIDNCDVMAHRWLCALSFLASLLYWCSFNNITHSFRLGFLLCINIDNILFIAKLAIPNLDLSSWILFGLFSFDLAEQVKYCFTRFAVNRVSSSDFNSAFSQTAHWNLKNVSVNLLSESFTCGLTILLRDRHLKLLEIVVLLMG